MVIIILKNKKNQSVSLIKYELFISLLVHKLNCFKASYSMGLLKESKSTMIYTNLHQVLYVWPLTRKRSLRFAVLKRRGGERDGMPFERLELSVQKQ